MTRYVWLRTTMRPDLEVEVSVQEATDLRRWGLIAPDLEPAERAATRKQAPAPAKKDPMPAPAPRGGVRQKAATAADDKED